MAGALHHRGPDDSGKFVRRNAGLVSTRLAIIDLAGGHMPLSNEDGSVWVTFNGELYNHREQRARLEAEGHTFRTHADTEVLVHAYERDGAELCRGLTGMFAFALWDEKNGRLVLARDRFGIKPLYVAKSDDRKVLLFASEAKAILATGRVSPRIDGRALLDVMSAGYPMPPRSMFHGIESMAPGTSRTYDVHGAQKSRVYWTMPYPSERRPPKRGQLEAAAEELRARMGDVVREHLVADVPVGSYLSGGIDSISVATLAAKSLDRPLQTFSMGFGTADARFDESMLVEEIVAKIGAQHVRLQIPGISAEDYLGTIEAMEAPQVHTVAFCLYQLSRTVRDSGLKVVLSGEGSDELFAGYSVFRFSRFRNLFSGPLMGARRGLVRLLMLLGGDRSGLLPAVLDWWRREGEVSQRYGLVPPWVEQWWLLADESAAILGKDGRGRLAALAGGDGFLLPEPPGRSSIDTEEVGGDSTRPIAASDPRARARLHRELLFEQRSRLDGWVLALGDRLTMAHSVEGRVPFLDHRIAELTAEVPPGFLLRGRKQKYLLRRAMEGVIPESARTRKKRAFVAPITRWLFESGRPEFVEDALSERSLRDVGLFDHAAIRERLDYLATGKRGVRALRASWALNVALGTQLFCKRFGVVG
jgi:asparagine synthase (glutamine-hydrolysing)